MKVRFITLGCKVNQYETEAMSELFDKRGYEVTGEEVADIYVINTCTVTNLSDRKSRQLISKARKQNPDALIAVVGCYSQVSPDEVSALEGVHVVLGTKERKKVVDFCEDYLENREAINSVHADIDSYDFDEMDLDHTDAMTRAYIKVQEGCNQFCTYCIIPYARGPIRSRNVERVIEEANRLAENGYREVVITGIHVSSYGLDRKEKDALISLIEKIHEVDGIDRIRLSSLEPRIITKEFLTRLSSLPKVCDHFHLSLQSGSNKILKSMNRRYGREEYMEKLKLIRTFYPNAGLTTDVIVGFPGENEEDFQQTMNLVKEIGFLKVHVFPYSKRKGTKAYDFRDQVDSTVKKERSHQLIHVSKIATEAFLDQMIGSTADVLIENIKDGQMEGYTSNYIRVMVKGKPIDRNQMVQVSLKERQEELIYGTIKENRE